MTNSNPHRGFTLLEALISLLIFSVGIIGTISLQSNLLKNNLEAQWRIQASLLAAELTGMASADSTNLACYVVPTLNQPGCTNATSTGFTNGWVTEVKGSLPQATNTPPTAVLGNDGSLTVTIYWSRPGTTLVHQYVTVILPG